MWLAIISLITGSLLGSILTISVPVVYAKYLSVAILAALDSLLGGVRAILEDDFDGTIMLSGFIVNALMAAGLAFLGDRIGLDLYLVGVIAFGLRIFGNLGYIRRDILEKWRSKKRKNYSHSSHHTNEESGIVLPQVTLVKETVLPHLDTVLSDTLQNSPKQEAPDDNGQPK